MDIIESLKHTVQMNLREVETQRRIFMAVDEKEKELLWRFEKWLDMIETELSKESK